MHVDRPDAISVTNIVSLVDGNHIRVLAQPLSAEQSIVYYITLSLNAIIFKITFVVVSRILISSLPYPDNIVVQLNLLPGAKNNMVSLSFTSNALSEEALFHE